MLIRLRCHVAPRGRLIKHAGSVYLPKLAKGSEWVYYFSELRGQTKRTEVFSLGEGEWAES